MEKGQGGIQMLLAAEQEAQQIVSAARAGMDFDPSSSLFLVLLSPPLFFLFPFCFPLIPVYEIDGSTPYAL